MLLEHQNKILFVIKMLNDTKIITAEVIENALNNLAGSVGFEPTISSSGG